MLGLPVMLELMLLIASCVCPCQAREEWLRSCSFCSVARKCSEERTEREWIDGNNAQALFLSHLGEVFLFILRLEVVWELWVIVSSSRFVRMCVDRGEHVLMGAPLRTCIHSEDEHL